jgi:pimeloyl-ACP methyl ester carboxylesterase
VASALRLPLALLLALTAASACGRARATGTLARERCRDVDVPGARCSSLTVYENRAARSGRTIPLRIVVLPAKQQPRAADAVTFLAGGPGEAATHMASADFLVNHPLRTHRDIVLVDQRGTGGSHDLRCQFYGPPSDVQNYFGPFMPPDKARACASELSPDADLTQYTTSNAVEDLEQMRASLRYERLNLIGVSYGTRLAMEYVRAHEARVRAVMLYGAVPPALAMPQGFGASAQRALDGVLAECAATPACRAAFPSIKEEARIVFERLKQSPAKTTVSLDERTVTVTLTRDMVAEIIRYMTYSSGQASSVPLVLHRAAHGDFSAIAVDAWRRRHDGTFDGLYLAITCTEDVPFVAATAAEDDEPTYLGGYRVRQQRAGCESWPRGGAPSWRNTPVSAKAPVLFVSGGLDPVTPASFAQEIRRTLPNSTQILIKSGGHNLAGLSHPECLGRIEQQFIEKGTLTGLDTRCAAQMTRPGFVVR